MCLPSAFPECSFLSAFLRACEEQVGCGHDSGRALSATLLYVVPEEWSTTRKKVQGTSFKRHNLSPSLERESGPSIPKNDKCHSKLAVLALGLLGLSFLWSSQKTLRLVNNCRDSLPSQRWQQGSKRRNSSNRDIFRHMIARQHFRAI